MTRVGTCPKLVKVVNSRFGVRFPGGSPVETGISALSKDNPVSRGNTGVTTDPFRIERNRLKQSERLGQGSCPF